MTLDEARQLVGRTVVLRALGGRPPEEVVITGVTGSFAYVCRRDRKQHGVVLADELTPLAEGETRPELNLVAASQASVNEFSAAMIRAASADDPEQAASAIGALRELNWAAGFDFEGALPPPAPPGEHARQAVSKARALEMAWDADKLRARTHASELERAAPPEAAAVLRRVRAGAPALVYVITHPALGAVKVGVSDAAGERIAVHRRAGWQLIAAFQVAADAAAAIEDDVLSWWRRDLGLPPYLTRDQMPQDGWTETVAASRIDLAATVAHVCEQATMPNARPDAASA